MNILLKINWILTVILSIATGFFKLLQQEADIELFSAIGFNATGTTILGAIQLLGGLLMIVKRTRTIGAYVMIPTFIIASAAVFANEMLAFGVVSLIFILMAVGVVLMDKRSHINRSQS